MRSDLSQQVTTRMQHVNIRLTTGMHKNLFLMVVALLSISPASHGQIMKMLITLKLHGIFGSNCIRVYLNAVQPLVYTTVTRLLGKFKTLKYAENHNIYFKLQNMQIMGEIIKNNIILKTWNRNFVRPTGCVSVSVCEYVYPFIFFPHISSGTIL